MACDPVRSPPIGRAPSDRPMRRVIGGGNAAASHCAMAMQAVIRNRRAASAALPVAPGVPGLRIIPAPTEYLLQCLHALLQPQLQVSVALQVLPKPPREVEAAVDVHGESRGRRLGNGRGRGRGRARRGRLPDGGSGGVLHDVARRGRRRRR